MGAIAGAIGGEIIGGVINSATTAHANRMNRQLNRENRDWEERMSNTAYQRGTQDLLRAGLNPMLALSKGPASTPNNSAPTVEKNTALGDAVTGAANKVMQNATIENTQANTAKTVQEARKTSFEADIAAWSAKNAEVTQNLSQTEQNRRIDEAIERAKLTDAQRKQLEAMLPWIGEQAQAQLNATRQSTTSAAAKQRLDELAVPESEAAARWFSGPLGGGGRITNALKDVIQTIRMIKGRK